MDGTRFDRLARAWFAAANRRAVLRALIGLPLGAVAANLFAAEPSDAAQRDDESTDDVGDEQQSRKQRCRRHKGKGRGHHGRRKSCQARHGGHHKPHKKKPCQPDPTATTCDGRCGPVTNNCQQDVDCGSCACNPSCEICQSCDESSGQCVDLPDGTACGDGLRCLAVQCVCDGESCPDGCCQGGECLVDDDKACGIAGGNCTPCTLPQTCGGGGTSGQCGCTPVATCPGGLDCGTIDDGCGDTISCGGPCSNPAPICFNNVCAPCSGNTPCPIGQVCCAGSCFAGICCGPADCSPVGNNCDANQCTCGNGAACSGDTPTCCDFPTSVCTDTDTDENNCGNCGNVCPSATPVCWDGECVCGDVCPNGCQFTSVADAVAVAPGNGGIIRICAGDYITSVDLLKSLTIRGAGAGLTTLRGPGDRRIFDIGNFVVRIEDLTITGGNSGIGGGINNDGPLTLVRVIVTGNMSPDVGGGIVNFSPVGAAQLVLDNSHVSLNTAGDRGGGIINSGGTVTLINGSTVTNNTAIQGGGIFVLGGTVTLEPGSFVCDNSEPQCTGFTPPSGFCGACP
jgi:hypothetical protein